MPHIIIEFSQGQADTERITALLDAVHKAAASTGLFDEDHIRVRAYPCEHFYMGGEKKHFIHVQLRIHSGRDEGQKQQLSRAVLQAIKAQQWSARSITVEVVDMDRATYAKYKPVN